MHESFARVIAIASIAILSGAIALWLSKLMRRRRVRRRMACAVRGEHAARALLESLGFEVQRAQAPGAIALRVDGQEIAYGIRADYLVRRGGLRFVAEVKTGALAPSLDHGPTRRQLLEYAAAFDVDTVLLVDPEASRVREVSFARTPRAARWPAFASGLVVGLVVSALLALTDVLTSP